MRSPMASALIGILRILHIFAAVSWVGGGFFWGMVVAPNVLRRGPPTLRRPFLEAALGPITRFFIGSGVAAIVFGALLMGAMWKWDFQAPFQVVGYGAALAVGIVGALVMIVHGAGFVAPTGRKLLATMQATNGPPTEAQQAELMRLGKSMGIHGMLSILLGTIALAGMVVAVNYVR